MRISHIVTIGVTLLLCGCSATRYVPTGKYLLKKNVVDVTNEKGIYEREMISPDKLAGYIKQRPNRKILGIGYSLGFYNMTDTTKHNWWHNFWRDKVGSAPVIFDSTQMLESTREMQIYLGSRGFLNATVTDSVELKDKIATVTYRVKQNKPYTISYVDYNIEDPYIRSIVLQDSTKNILKPGDIFDRQILQSERMRITNQLKNRGFFYFGSGSINYVADSSWNDNTVSVQLNIKQRLSGYAAGNKPIYTNHPIYRIKRIVINTDFDPTSSIEQTREKHYDTITHNGVDIVYSGRLQMKPELLVASLRFQPNSLYDETLVQRSNTNIRDLGYTTSILFSPIAVSDSLQTRTVTVTGEDGKEYLTIEGDLMCLIQCTPIKSQSITEEFELSSTAAYSSAALTLGYQNRNLFGGAENFSVSVRGAFELVRGGGKRNSYELGVTSSLSLPRLLLPIGDHRLGNIRQKSTKLQLNYNIQERPDYHRTVFGAVYGYNWTTPKGSRISINPIDINVVHVPWIDSTFDSNIENPYLRNSYQSQMIAGLSASYFYGSTPKYQESGYSFRVMADTNGNLISLVESLITSQGTYGGESYNTLLGLRYAQYARASFDYSQRQTLNNRAQLAWRIFIGAGIPYGNSSVIPFERLFFAGGSNSMRGWQIRTLGAGGTPYPDDDRYPNQLGDMRLEGNLEFRYNVWSGLNLAIFMDAGNVWMNSKGRESDEAMFRFNTFYKQIALNTGAGLRWDFDIFLLRLDWGLKLRSPGMPEGQRWFKQMGFSDTVFHFAIGLPF